jgi:cysteine synthase A
MALNYCPHRIQHDATAILIFHDRGECYLDTIYSESWVKEYFGDVSSLWHDLARDPKVTMTY